jgi:hypothetical protein
MTEDDIIIYLNHKIENPTHKEHVYKIGDKGLLSRGTEKKHDFPYQGHFPSCAYMEDQKTYALPVSYLS